MSLYKKFKSEIKLKLKEKLWKKNIFETPEITKVIVCSWIWSLATRKWVKDFSDLENSLFKITWQKPFLIKSKKAISNFKLREWMPSMLKVTLRWKKAYDFIEKMVKLTLPRARDFEWLNPKNLDWSWNINIWFNNHSVFPEIWTQDLNNIYWIQITIVSTSSKDEETLELLKHLWFIIKK